MREAGAFSLRIAEPIIIDPDLMEIGMGSAEGITEAGMHERWPRLKAALVGRSWYVDETYIRVHGHWKYLYRAIDR